jgi:Tol biopolymer transport system component
MKRAIFIFGSLVFTLMNLLSQQSEFPKLTNPYLGQKPSGVIPEIFAPGIISLGYHEHRIAISPDGNEIFYSVASPNKPKMQIMQTKLANGSWDTPSLAPFSDIGMNLHPAFSPDGKRLFFVSTRPLLKNGVSSNRADIWFVDRQENGWSNPVNIGNSINTENNESSPTVMSDRTIFFESNRNSDKKDWDIYVSYLINGVYQKAEKLSSFVNTEFEEGGPFVSPDGSYLLFNSNRPGSYGESDLYITLKNNNGEWEKPINLGEKINSKYYDWSPIITPDGTSMIFSSYRNVQPLNLDDNNYSRALKKDFGLPKPGNGTFYWIDTGFLLDLRKNSQDKLKLK